MNFQMRIPTQNLVINRLIYSRKNCKRKRNAIGRTTEEGDDIKSVF